LKTLKTGTDTGRSDMGFEDVLSKYFDKVYSEVDFVKKSYNALKRVGFNDENAIASVCVCRDEISQSMRSIVKHMWGEAFNLSSLAGMFTAGKTGLKAAMHHAPQVDGRERYVYYVIPHIAINEEGKTGFCKRKGIKEDSSACGALCLFLDELRQGKLHITIDEEDIEESLIKRRLLQEIPYGHVPDLLELTKITRKVIQTDLEHVLEKVVDIKKSDYAIMTGIQIHGPDGNYVWPSECYVVVNGEREDIKLSEW
jgi:Limiting CO2-inducible proteins B/C beta carbonyic anhydrases